jgi:hypothetical protein
MQTRFYPSERLPWGGGEGCPSQGMETLGGVEETCQVLIQHLTCLAVQGSTGTKATHSQEGHQSSEGLLGCNGVASRT